MAEIIPFPSKANTEPMIWSDYWQETIPVEDILSILERVKKEQDDRTDS
jgi:hypothetical protein